MSRGGPERPRARPGASRERPRSPPGVPRMAPDAPRRHFERPCIIRTVKNHAFRASKCVSYSKNYAFRSARAPRRAIWNDFANDFRRICVRVLRDCGLLLCACARARFLTKQPRKTSAHSRRALFFRCDPPSTPSIYIYIYIYIYFMILPGGSSTKQLF